MQLFEFPVGVRVGLGVAWKSGRGGNIVQQPDSSFQDQALCDYPPEQAGGRCL